jgi:tetratricopeptide (TPR) repeat protein
VVIAAGCAGVSRRSSGAKSASSTLRSEAELRRAAQAHAHFSAGVIYELNDQIDLALEEYLLAAESGRIDEDMLLDISRRFVQHKKQAQALEILNRAASRPEASGAVYAQLAFVYAQLGRTGDSIAASRTAIQKSPESLSGYQNLFLNYLQGKQTEQARAVLAEAAAQQDAGLEFLIELSELYMNFGVQVPAERESSRTNALAILKRAEPLAERVPMLKLRLADGFQLLGDSDSAARLYQQVLKQLPDAPGIMDRVRARLAEIYLQSNDRDKAAEQLRSIIKDDPTNPQAQYFLGMIAYEQKQFDVAADYLSRTLVLNPDMEQAYYDLAAAQIAQERATNAVATLDKARGKFQPSFMLEYLTAMAYNAQERFGESIKYFTAAEVVGKATAPRRLTHLFYFQMGAAHERAGQYEEAERVFEKVLELSPDFAEAQNYLGYMWAEQGRNLGRARELIEKAVAAEPKNAAFLDSLGWVLFKLGKPQEALVPMKSALDLTEEPDSTLYDHIGDIYQALGRLEEARRSWEKSLSLKDDPKVRTKLDAPAPGGAVPPPQ